MLRAYNALLAELAHHHRNLLWLERTSPATHQAYLRLLRALARIRDALQGRRRLQRAVSAAATSPERECVVEATPPRAARPSSRARRASRSGAARADCARVNPSSRTRGWRRNDREASRRWLERGIWIRFRRARRRESARRRRARDEG